MSTRYRPAALGAVAGFTILGLPWVFSAAPTLGCKPASPRLRRLLFLLWDTFSCTASSPSRRRSRTVGVKVIKGGFVGYAASSPESGAHCGAHEPRLLRPLKQRRGRRHSRARCGGIDEFASRPWIDRLSTGRQLARS